MAPSSRPNKNGSNRGEDEYYGIKGDRKARKPLVEKKRRARINESLQELRTLLADTEFQSKMENAEVLEMTVKRVENILQKRAQEVDTVNREASERFAAGYIQCMHEVHTFVSNCPGIDATVAAELLNHLLESMPLNDQDHFQDIIVDLMSDSSNGSAWPATEGIYAALVSPGARSMSSSSPLALSPAPSTTSSEDLGSDLEETESEQNHISPEVVENREVQNMPTTTYTKYMWRPW
ncbi:transcription cofactor HES-6-like [Paramormyrops kingsleyae]|uniref:Hes family bHLH transcription factor 6 n=1 Tax=Paramormyrops kingsleyae TaxID=1676925 RepID=A0A3B3RWI9_9TELE|nr:transcription cofactor HES-6-like [Paramormyrops kingsleyae]